MLDDVGGSGKVSWMRLELSEQISGGGVLGAASADLRRS